MTAPAIDAARIDEALVRGLIAEQFPRWERLPLRPVPEGGNDHRMFRLGDALTVRLPSVPGYIPQVGKEQTWLPRLAPLVPLPIPVVEGAGRPTERFPAPWSVYRWLPGRPASSSPLRDASRFAERLAGFLVALRDVDPHGAPASGLHSAFRGGPLSHWDEEMDALLLRVDGRERDLARGLWRDALAAVDEGVPRWFHGDVSLNNLLVDEGGALSAVIDFGCAAAGDPACDTVIRWTAFRGAARERFRRVYDADDATWARGRGWALWKGLIMITNEAPGQAAFARRVLDELFAEV